ncbi:MAG TPA: hypothetical protein PLC98_02930 [Anaerolineales bacterium]|nr:hypothetical protein [Anaerolineales bacterium]
MVMHLFDQLRRAMPVEVIETLDQAQLATLRWIVKFNRTLADVFRWARPMAAYWWMPVAGLGIGLVAGLASRLAG